MLLVFCHVSRVGGCVSLPKSFLWRTSTSVASVCVAPVDTDSKYARFSTPGFDEPLEEAGTRKGAINWGPWPNWRSWLHQGQEKAKLDHPFGTPSKGTIQVDGLWDCQERLALWFYLLPGAGTLRNQNTGLSGDHTLYGMNSVDPENIRIHWCSQEKHWVLEGI